MKLLHVLLALALGGCLPYLYTPSDTQEITTRSGGKQREYLLHVPPSYTKAKPAPLVITIHGFSQWPAHQLWLSRWNKLADEKGFITVYPSGTGLPKRWAMGGSNHAQFDPAPDIRFLKQMIAEIARDYSIDASRIYVNGLSNGGGMTYLLACELADHIAAVGLVAPGILEPKSCNPSRPVPVIAFHGTDDPVVPYGGGTLFVAPTPFPSTEGWVAAWGGRNGCAPAPVTASVTTHVRTISYGGCAAGSEVVLYKIEGGGHTWPGGEDLPEIIAGYTTHEIDATRLMWAFFEKHARRPASAH